MEEIIFDDYDEYEIEKKPQKKAVKNHRYSSGIRKCALALALAVVVSTGFSAVPGKFNNMATVEAARKKDKKKPVIKLSGKSNIRVTQNESVKIPKATAKDNVDGNVTKKIKVSVKSDKGLEEHEVINMCQAVREMKEVSRQEGRQEGAIKVYYQKMNYTVEQIAEEMNMDVEDVERVIETLDD